MKHGFGIYYWPNGKRFEGNWENGRQHGEGKYIFPEKYVKYGIWDKGNRIKYTKIIYLDKNDNSKAKTEDS